MEVEPGFGTRCDIKETRSRLEPMPRSAFVGLICDGICCIFVFDTVFRTDTRTHKRTTAMACHVARLRPLGVGCFTSCRRMHIAKQSAGLSIARGSPSRTRSAGNTKLLKSAESCPRVGTALHRSPAVRDTKATTALASGWPRNRSSECARSRAATRAGRTAAGTPWQRASSGVACRHAHSPSSETSLVRRRRRAVSGC